ncbi:MAG: BofC C-terminal domain-containing protein [Alkaliphilus sp.]|nr:BofC C-terminal domain-containing protein [Alkaliphilus sp.]
MRRRVFPVIISFLILALVFSSIGFVVAYYKYSGQIARERSEMQREQELLQALIKAQEESSYNINKDNNDKITVSNYNDIINYETQLIYKTLYTQCEDIIEEVRSPTSELIGLNKDGLEEYLIGNQLDWEIECFSKEKIVLSKQVNKICPNHYLVSVNKGCIAIYKYYENGEKKLIRQTDIPINILPIIDQEKLQKGILVNTEKEVNQLLEDYSS